MLHQMVKKRTNHNYLLLFFICFFEDCVVYLHPKIFDIFELIQIITFNAEHKFYIHLLSRALSKILKNFFSNDDANYTSISKFFERKFCTI